MVGTQLYLEINTSLVSGPETRRTRFNEPLFSIRQAPNALGSMKDQCRDQPLCSVVLDSDGTSSDYMNSSITVLNVASSNPSE